VVSDSNTAVAAAAADVDDASEDDEGDVMSQQLREE